MTSVARSFAKRPEGITLFLKPESPSYIFRTVGETDFIRLFPFTYSRGVLDITYDGNNFQSVMVDNTNVQPSDETDTVVRIMGGPRLVTGLGDNFKEYVRAWRDGIIDAGSPIELYKPAQVLRVQEGDLDHVTADSTDSFLISDKPPSNDEYVAGSVANQYTTTFIFKTPLTFTYIASGVTKYVTFRTALDQE